MHRTTLKERLLKWLRNHPQWVASGDLQRIVSQTTDYTPQNVGRRLRELQTEGLIEVRYQKNHAHYRAVAKAPSMDVWFDEQPNTTHV
jgi:DNA-binding transcriptional ArsR family regulator